VRQLAFSSPGRKIVVQFPKTSCPAQFDPFKARTMKPRSSSPFVVLALMILTTVGAAPTHAQVAQEAVDLQVVEQIRAMGLESAHLEEMARHLTEVIGPRLTGSPGMTAANEWTAQMFREWGLEVTVRRDTPNSWYQPESWEVRTLRDPSGREGTRLVS